LGGSFENHWENGFIPYWVQGCSTGCTPNQIDTTVDFDGGSSVKMERKASTDPVTHYRNGAYINQQKAEPVTVTVMSKATNVQAKDGAKQSNDYGVWAHIIFQDGTTADEGFTFPTGTEEWNRSGILLKKDKPIKTIQIYLKFQGDVTGTAWFDAVRVIEGNILTKQ
jgi:uncharacterized protein RhaS with RHS repeats